MRQLQSADSQLGIDCKAQKGEYWGKKQAKEQYKEKIHV